MRSALLGLAALLLAVCVGARPAAASDPWSTDPVYFFCHALNPSEGVVYVSDVHRVGPFAERKTYPDLYAEWLRASGRLGEGKGRCLMRATMREIERDRRDLPVSGCFECRGPAVYRDVKWPFGDAPIDSVRVADIEPPRGAISASEEAALDRREDPATRGGTSVYGRIDLTDAIARTGADSSAEAVAATKEKGGKWYPVLTEDRCPGYGAVSFAAGDKSRRYFIGRGTSEAAASMDAMAKAEAYLVGRTGWDTGLLTTYFNDTVQVDNRSLGDKVEGAVKNWVRGEIVKPDAPTERTLSCWGVRG